MPNPPVKQTPACRTTSGVIVLMAQALPLMVGVILSAGCSSSATAPTPLEPPPGAYRSTFMFMRGEGGFGGISVTPKSIPEGLYAADISVRLIGLKANTTYMVQRAQEGVGGRPLGSDQICQRAAGLSPWSPSDPPAPLFQTIPLPATGPLVSLTTGPNGDGSLDFEFRTLMILAGTTNDVMFRLIDSEISPTTELRSECMTITAR